MVHDSFYLHAIFGQMQFGNHYHKIDKWIPEWMIENIMKPTKTRISNIVYDPDAGDLSLRNSFCALSFPISVGAAHMASKQQWRIL